MKLPQNIAAAALTGLWDARLHWLLGLRFAIACGVPPIIGAAAEQPLAGVIASVGALFPMLADVGGNIRQRVTLMLATSFFMTAGLVVSALGRRSFAPVDSAGRYQSGLHPGPGWNRGCLS